MLAIIPTNIVGAMAGNDILSVMFFALVFGIGIVLTDRPEAHALKRGIEGLFEISMRLIGVVIRLAPIAVFCFMFNLAALFGWELLVRLSAYVGVVLAALGAQMFIVFPLLLLMFARKSPLAFFHQTQEATVMAFATASSNATLPTALRVADERLKLPAKVARFVLTIGATANQNGTAMFEGVTVLFLAQFFGVELSLAQQFTVMLICILGGIGTAGVPAGSLPVVALILGMVGVPPAGNRAGARRRSISRYVPDNAQCYGRPRAGDGHFGLGAQKRGCTGGRRSTIIDADPSYTDRRRRRGAVAGSARPAPRRRTRSVGAVEHHARRASDRRGRAACAPRPRAGADEGQRHRRGPDRAGIVARLFYRRRMAAERAADRGDIAGRGRSLHRHALFRGALGAPDARRAGGSAGLAGG